MSTRRTRSRALVPMPEDLESRRLLSQTVSGLDEKGDQWVLKLIGPGALRVTKQPDSSGNPTALGDQTAIDAITVAGTNPSTSRLIGQVKPAPGSDGRVFFSSLTDQGTKSEGIVANDGISTIDMPDFYLGQTSTASGATEPSISIADGVNTLRFGGADTTYTPPGGTPLNTNSTADAFTIELGLPRTIGTSIVVNKVTTDAQAAAASSSGSATSPTQDSVTFTVDGRINVFQANEIDGNTTYPSTGFQGGGGTLVNSTIDPATQYTGQIGFVRVGGNATDFAVQTNDKISNYYIGGETNNVQLLAPDGSRDVQFGKGMDNVTILTHYIDTLQANRGANNSTVTIDRNVGNVTFGGPVTNTNVQAGYAQGLASIYSSQTAPDDGARRPDWRGVDARARRRERDELDLRSLGRPGIRRDLRRVRPARPAARAHHGQGRRRHRQLDGDPRRAQHGVLCQ